MIPTYNPINGDPGNSVAPRRPGIDDMGGATMIDDLEKPPNQQTMPSAAGDNIKQRLAVSYGKVVPVCIGSVHFSSGTPSIAFLSPAGDNVLIATITVTDNGNGDTSLTWPANTFPSPVIDHEASLTGSSAGMIGCQTLTNGLRVRTLNSSAVATDLPFNFKIY